MKQVRIHPDIEALIKQAYYRESSFGLQHAVDCLLADRFKKERPLPGIQRMAQSKIIGDERAMSKSGLWRRQQRDKAREATAEARLPKTLNPGGRKKRVKK